MLPHEFTEKTGITGDIAYVAANAWYMSDGQGAIWKDNTEFCKVLMRSPKMLVMLINKMGELIVKNNEEHAKELNGVRTIIGIKEEIIASEKAKNTRLKNTLLNIKNQSEQSLLEL